MIRDHAPETGSMAGSGAAQPELASPEVEVLAMLREHAPREGAALSAYQHLVDATEDAGVRYLGRLILEDERRHHGVINEMVQMLEAFTSGAPRGADAPELRPRSDPELRAATTELLALEREDARELRQLQRALRGASVPALLPLLVDLMIHDTRKHIAILRAIRSHTRRA
ncbi:MAG: hypothetical protein ACO1PW_03910 [Actinomycetota bacterium]